MRIQVKAKPGARQDMVEKVGEATFVVWVKAPPVQGKANESIRALLSEYFHVSKMSVVIVSGHASRNKTIDIIT